MGGLEGLWVPGMLAGYCSGGHRIIWSPGYLHVTIRVDRIASSPKGKFYLLALRTVVWFGEPEGPRIGLTPFDTHSYSGSLN